MAEIRGLVRPAQTDILSGLRLGVGIAQRAQAQQLAREQFERTSAQLRIENERQRQLMEQKTAEFEYNKGVRRMKMGRKFGNVDMMREGLTAAMGATGANVPENFPIEQETYDNFLKALDEKDPALREDMEDEFLNKFGQSLSAFGRQVEALGLPGAEQVERTRELEETIAGEERAVATAKELATFETGEAIRKQKAGLQAAADIATQAREEQQKKFTDLLARSGLPPKQQNRMLIAFQEGIGASAEAALFPKDQERISFIERENPETFAIERVPVRTFTDPKTGKFVYQVAEEFVPPAPEGAPPPTAEPTPEPVDLPEVDIAQNFSFEEYKASIVNRQAFTERQLADAYTKLIKQGKLRRPGGRKAKEKAKAAARKREVMEGGLTPADIKSLESAKQEILKDLTPEDVEDLQAVAEEFRKGL
jgi:hypothetical protein